MIDIPAHVIATGIIGAGLLFTIKVAPMGLQDRVDKSKAERRRESIEEWHAEIRARANKEKSE